MRSRHYYGAGYDGNHLAVKQCTAWQPFASVGNMRELRSEEITATRPKRYFAFVSACQAAIAVKLNFVEPFLAFGDVLNSKGIHRLDEIESGGVSSSCFHLGIV